MSIIEFDKFLLLVIFITSILVVREDIKTKLIPNKFIFFAAIIGLFFYGVALVFKIVTLAYFADVVMNTVISFIVTFVVWKLALWPAGDAKLFILFSFLLPLRYYAQTRYPFFHSFVIFINISCIYLVYLIATLILKVAHKILNFYQKGGRLEPFLSHFLSRKWGEMFESVKMKIFSWNWKRFLEDKRGKKFLGKVFFRIFIKILILTIFAIFFNKKSFQFKFIPTYFLFFFILRLLFQMFVNSYGRKDIKVTEIKKGMILVEETINQLKVSETSFVDGFGTLRAEGITEKQAMLIKNKLIEKGIHNAQYYDTIPFSPFIVIGIVMTILIKGSALYFLKLFFR